MLSSIMLENLNKQITKEFYSSNLYLQMSAWCEDKNYVNCAKFLRAHALEEREHMEKIYNYVLDAGSYPKLSAIDAPMTDFSGLEAVFKTALEHERSISKSINNIVDIAFTQKDYTTFNFLQWFVKEQHEEENTFNAIYGKFELIGNEKSALYFFDKEISSVSVTTEMSQ